MFIVVDCYRSLRYTILFPVYSLVGATRIHDLYWTCPSPELVQFRSGTSLSYSSRLPCTLGSNNTVLVVFEDLCTYCCTFGSKRETDDARFLANQIGQLANCTHFCQI